MDQLTGRTECKHGLPLTIPMKYTQKRRLTTKRERGSCATDYEHKVKEKLGKIWSCRWLEDADIMICLFCIEVHFYVSVETIISHVKTCKRVKYHGKSIYTSSLQFVGTLLTAAMWGISLGNYLSCKMANKISDCWSVSQSWRCGDPPQTARLKTTDVAQIQNNSKISRGVTASWLRPSLINTVPIQL